jgi:hypothetical protein
VLGYSSEDVHFFSGAASANGSSTGGLARLLMKGAGMVVVYILSSERPENCNEPE